MLHPEEPLPKYIFRDQTTKRQLAVHRLLQDCLLPDKKKSLDTYVDMPNCQRYFKIYFTIYRGTRYNVLRNTVWETVLRQNLHILKQNSISVS